MAATIQTIFETIQGGTWNPKVEVDLLFSLNSFVDKLLEHGQLEKSLWIWNKALEIIPALSSRILVNYATYLTNLGLHLKAFDSINEYLENNESSIEILEIRENLSAFLVDRWHFRMLNDIPRNSAYDKAIRCRIKGLKHEAIVLDIGGGTGILSCYAARAGAEHVYCCEMNESLAIIAERCINDNGLSDRITVLRKKSQDIVVGVDIPRKVDLIVTELVDSGLVGEHIIEVLCHARNFLLESNGFVIPHSADVYCMPISCAAVAMRERRVLPDTHHKLNRASDEKNESQYSWAELLAESSCTHLLSVDERYTCESLEFLQHIALLQDPWYVSNVILDGSNIHIDNCDCKTALLKSLFTFQSEHSVSLDAFACWFDLHLVDTTRLTGDEAEDFIISTRPSRPHNGWDQAIYFANFEGTPELQLAVGSRVELMCAIYSDHFEFQVLNLPLCGSKLESLLSEPTMHSGLELGERRGSGSELDGPLSERGEEMHELFQLGEMDFALINDWERSNVYMTALVNAVKFLENRLEARDAEDLAGKDLSGQGGKGEPPMNIKNKSEKQVRVFESCSSWQSIAISALMLAYNDKLQSSSSLLFSNIVALVHCGHDDISRYFRTCCALAKVPVESCRIVSCPIVDLVDIVPEKYNLYICDIVEGSGLLRPHALKDVRFASEFFLCKGKGQTPFHSLPSPSLHCVIPHSITLVVTLAECYSLREQHRVLSDHTVGIEVTRINSAGSFILRELDLASLQGFRELSVPTDAVTVSLTDLGNLSFSSTTIYEEYSARADVCVPITVTGVVHAICFWFKIKMCDSAEESCVIDTSSSSGHWRQAAFLLDDGVCVSQNSMANISVKIDESFGVFCSYNKS